MTFSGSITVLDTLGSIDKPLFKSGFIVPVKNDIEALQGGAAIDFTGLNQIEAVNVVSSDRLIIRTASGGTRSISLAETGIALGANNVRPILTKEDIGVLGDGVTDDAPALQAAYDLYSQLGGAAFMLRAQQGQSFYFKGSPRGASNISTIFVSPHTVTNSARLTLQGEATAAANSGAFTLLADTAAGDGFIAVDTSPHGGGAVSTKFAVGDMIRIRGLRDSCGTAREEQELRVTAITDGTSRLDVTPVLNAAFKASYPAGDYEAATGQANVSLISKLVTVLAAADVAAGDNLWTFAAGDLGKLTAGDYVMGHAENRCSDIGGSNDTLTHVEIAQVIASAPGDSANSLRLSRRLERDFTTAKFARLVKLNVIQNASIQSATVEFTQAPEPGAFVHPFEIVYGVDCVLADCTVPNRDAFGTRGNSHRITRSLACSIERPIARGALYVDDGEGNGAVLASCVDCRVVGGTLSGMRHSMLALGATNCLYQDITVQNPRHTPLDCHGAHEVGVRFVNIIASASTDYEADPGNAPVAILFGNSTLLAGAHRCGVEGGRFVGFRAADGNHEPCIRAFPPSTDCYVRDAEFHRIGVLLGHEDIAGFGALVTRGLRVDGVSVDDWNGRLVDINGRANGASVDTLVDCAIYDLTARNGSLMIRALNVTELQVYECELDEITVDEDNAHFINADTCASLYVQNNSLTAIGRGLYLANCANFRVVGNIFADLTLGTVLQDLGGNTGIWQNNDNVGTTPTFTRSGGSVITESPRAAGVWEMEHETFISFKPERKTGVCRVWSHLSSELFAQFMYRCHADEGGLEIVPDPNLTTLNVDVTTGPLTGTTGVYDAFTISVTDGVIWFENQIGHGFRVDFSHS